MTIINNFTNIDKINRTIFFGDNLDILREKFPNVGGYFDLIYLDPPFNSNRNYNVLFEKKNEEDTVAQTHAFEDSWIWGHDSEKTFEFLTTDKKVDISIHELIHGFEKIIGKNNMLAYLVMMTNRLIELKRVLKDTGSIYLHCDPNASHYLKILMDNIFGYKNFQNEIIWRYRGRGMQNKRFQRKHDTILFYSKSENFHFFSENVRVPLDPKHSGRYNKVDENGKKYALIKKKDSGYSKIYFKEEGIVMDDVWDIPFIHGNESIGYPTQKPILLLERIIKASSNEGDLILDPFCGCGTTLAASEKLNRKWIGIDITPLAIGIIKKRLNEHFGEKFKIQNIEIKIDGLPKDMNGAIILAEKCGINGRFDFQYWILGLLDAMPTKNKSKDNKKGKDEGIDGIILFKEDNEMKKLIISVKSGKNPSVKEIRDLNGVIIREKAVGGLFVTLYEPTKDMKKEATVSGTYNFYNKKFQKIQIVMVKDLLDGKSPDIPHTQEPVYKEAVKVPIQLSDYNPVDEDMFV